MKSIPSRTDKTASLANARTDRRSCYAMARQRALRAHREGRHGLVVFLIFVWALLSAPFVPPPVVPLPRPMPARPLSPRMEPAGEMAVGFGPDVEVPALRPTYAAARRYKTRPSLSKLMADLRRGAARNDAAAELLPRIVDNDTRRWVADHIADNDITALAIHVRPGRPEEVSLAAWQHEARGGVTGGGEGAPSPEPTLMPNF